MPPAVTVASLALSTQHVGKGVLMKLNSSKLLALVFALGLPGVLEATGRESENPQPEEAQAAKPAVTTSPEAIAWDCVPSYWLGYWAWAWQPCPWLDRSYVQGAIGAVATGAEGVVVDMASTEAP